MNTSKTELNQLLDHLLAANSRADMSARLEQLLTPTEFDEVVKRLQILCMLDQGIPQRKIAETLGVGIATVSRGARARKES
ncbi:Trp family transcriptional regulator [Reinekea marina]|uniref:Trp family transcriptional regulator n=1 Tax=Reinekea marina TaxID=1310421 RepID=A0ABV7WPU0_9GAMM|nr:Trp family transcriptional regulator [Reinekea marina]MBU2863356.1 trp operon repressor [Reinekea forsetii]MDN3650786.1 Trp family transcriptional regulator [Reinekea marina]